MSEQLTCVNNHLYESTYEKCPYCPGENDDATVVENGDNIDLTGETEKTEFMDNKMDRTAIHQDRESENMGQVSGRKLVGWLVSFTWNPQGEDFKLREGKTIIGADNSSDICINDPEVSAHHCTLLYRSGKFRLKDEFSTNGTSINDAEIDEQTELKDGDLIKIGKTELKFRTT